PRTLLKLGPSPMGRPALNRVCENHETRVGARCDASIVRLNRRLTNGRAGRRPRGGQSVGGAPTSATSNLTFTTLHPRRRAHSPRADAHGVARCRSPSPFVLSARGHPPPFPSAGRPLHILVRLAVPEQ